MDTAGSRTVRPYTGGGQGFKSPRADGEVQGQVWRSPHDGGGASPPDHAAVVLDLIVLDRGGLTDPNALSMPPKITGEQVKGFALAMGRLVLSGDGDEVVNMARSNLCNLPRP
jgi:hypothetical protein